MSRTCVCTGVCPHMPAAISQQLCPKRLHSDTCNDWPTHETICRHSIHCIRRYAGVQVNKVYDSSLHRQHAYADQCSGQTANARAAGPEQSTSHMPKQAYSHSACLGACPNPLTQRSCAAPGLPGCQTQPAAVDQTVLHLPVPQARSPAGNLRRMTLRKAQQKPCRPQSGTQGQANREGIHGMHCAFLSARSALLCYTGGGGGAPEGG